MQAGAPETPALSTPLTCPTPHSSGPLARCGFALVPFDGCLEAALTQAAAVRAARCPLRRRHDGAERRWPCSSGDCPHKATGRSALGAGGGVGGQDISCKAPSCPGQRGFGGTQDGEAAQGPVETGFVLLGDRPGCNHRRPEVEAVPRRHLKPHRCVVSARSSGRLRRLQHVGRRSPQTNLSCGSTCRVGTQRWRSITFCSDVPKTATPST